MSFSYSAIIFDARITKEIGNSDCHFFGWMRYQFSTRSYERFMELKLHNPVYDFLCCFLFPSLKFPVQLNVLMQIRFIAMFPLQHCVNLKNKI